MTRFCANCGTEVDETAVFCPTCGQPIDQDVESAMPPAPSWPDPEPVAPVDAGDEAEPEPVASAPARWSDHDPDDDVDDAEATRVEARPEPAAEAPAPPPAASVPQPKARAVPPAPARPASPAMELPLTMPVTLSGWLIGGGAALGAVGALLALFDGLGTAVDLLLLIALIAVAASVFLSDRLPTFAHLRLATMTVVLIGFGIALDRLGFGRAGAGELLLFLGTAAAAIGAILLETGRDQPLGGPSA
jgi:hypothetical protein